MFITGLFLVLVTQLSQAQKWAVSTNLLSYAELVTLNASVNYAPHRNFTVNAAADYNPFTYNDGKDNQFQLRRLTASIGARWWPWHVYSGWWMGAKAQYQQYNFGGIWSRESEEGDKAGLGLSAGYTYMVNSHINLEFGLGLWAGQKWYRVYACPKCGYLLNEGSKSFVLPNDFMISLSYVF